jgi:hypothetical protein
VIHSGLVRYHDALEPLLIPTDSVCPHPDNYNNGDTEAIGESIDENGMAMPILIQESTGYIIHGNHTWMTLVERKATRIPAIIIDVTDDQAVRLMVGMNQIARLAQPDKAAMLDLLQTLESPTVGTGVDEYTMTALTKLAEMPPLYEDSSWPTYSFRLPPHMVRAFREMTDEAITDTDRFELLMRLAGWDGR